MRRSEGPPGPRESVAPDAPDPPDPDGDLAARWMLGGRRDEALGRIVAARKDNGGRLAAEDLDLRGIMLAGEDLSGLDLSGVDLSFANLSQADLSASRFTGACLRGANLAGAKLTESEFLNADLAGADLSDCDARRAGFGKADLTGANLFNMDATGGTFTQARLRGINAPAAKLSRARLLETDLTNADLSRAVLDHCDLGRSVVTGASFHDTDLRGARFPGLRGHAKADWIGTDIGGVDFCGAYLVRRTIEDQNYLHEFRNQNRLTRLSYQIWWITSDCGRSFVRWGLWTLLIIVSFAGIYETVEVDYGDYPSPISSIYYSVVTLTTLGYGDVLPASPAAQLVAMGQVMIGYVMLGGLLSIFSNKMARRAT